MKRYHITEKLAGQTRLWVRCLTRREASRQLASLQVRFPFRTFEMEVR